MRNALTRNFFGRSVNSFQFFGVIGFVAATALGLVLGYVTRLSMPVLVLLPVLAAAVFFLLALIAKIVTGEESIVYYHHEVAILVTTALFLYALGQPVLRYLDLTVLGIGTLLAFGRMGCHSVGCCHGKPAKKGVVYGHDHVEAGFTYFYEGIPLAPVQLVESTFVFFIVIVGSVLVIRHALPGTTLIVYTLVYGAFRFGIEFFRGDMERGYWKGLSEAQWTTLLLMLVCATFSAVGWFPFYRWEMFVVGAVVLWSMVVIIRHVVRGRQIEPKHVAQIASALEESNDPHSSIRIQEDQPGFVHVFQTDLGLSLSAGTIFAAGTTIKHYTLSCDGRRHLSQGLAKEIGRVIQQLERHPSSGELVRREQDVYHIVFKKA